MSETYMDWRDYAIRLVDDKLIDAETLLIDALRYMEEYDVKEMLKDNDLMPEDGDFDDYNYVGSPMHY